MKKINNDTLEPYIKEAFSKIFSFELLDLIEDTDATLFGGFIRDCIARTSINDADFVVGNNSYGVISSRLIDLGFKSRRISKDYGLVDSFQISRWSKDGTHEIDLIRCSMDHKFKHIIDKQAIRFVIYENIIRHIADVDINCCAVGFNLISGLFEATDNAYEECCQRLIVVNPNAKHYSTNRIKLRVLKLQNKGFKLFNPVNLDYEILKKEVHNKYGFSY